LGHPKRFHRRRHRIGEENRINTLHDIRRNLKEVPLVLQWNQRASSAVVHRNLQGFNKRAHRFDVSLNAQVAEDDEASLYRLSLDC
jgi:hypothetical protein